MRGKLVEQDPNDEPAFLSLGEGKPHKRQQIRSANLAGWSVAPVGSLLEFRYGKGLKASERLATGPVPVFGSNGIVGYCETPLTEVPSIIVGRKGSAGALNLCNGPSWTTDVAYFVEAPDYYNLRFLLIGLQALDLGSFGKGVKPGLSRSDAYDLPLSVPPLAEQRRIVAKVDELMALCDRLEAARAEREATRDRLAAASLARLNAPDPDPVTFRDHAAFALDNLTPLTARRDQIKALRQTILNLAVRGKLVEQDPNDEPASKLLKRIAVERAILVEQRQMRREKALAPTDPSEPPFEVPPQWVWSRLGSAVLFTQYGTSLKSYTGATGIPVLTMGNIREGIVVSKNQKTVPESSDDLPALYLRKFDILYNRTNSAELVGKTGIYLGENDCMTFASYLIRIRVSETVGCPQYLNLAMNTSMFRATQIVPLIKKQTGQANVNGTALKNMLVPLPPLAEQHRIVAKVDELMTLCDRLEAGLATCGDTRRRLLNALMYEALEPTTDREAIA